ncbi:hypothetical protein [Thermicanus aegyptius]|uniref:hypothetical protein n=1 Tax=Thermicanus aegyptius TaxID=94009 RepID=UPI0003FFAECB|nr:hypothetical protein [Thermicanus aegyptius]
MKSKVKSLILISFMLMVLFSIPFTKAEAAGGPFPVFIPLPFHVYDGGGVTQEVYKYKPNDAYKNSPYVVDGYYSHYLQTSDGTYLEIVGTDAEGNPLYINESGEKISGEQLNKLGAKVVSDDVVVKDKLEEGKKIIEDAIRNLLLMASLPAIALLFAFRL